MAKNTSGTDDTPAQAAIPAQFLGELIHATDIAHMACAAMVSRGIVNREVFDRFGSQIEQGWLALEANADDNNQAAIAWARRRMAEFMSDMECAHITSPNRRTVLADLMPAPLSEGETAPADAEPAAQEQ